MSGTTLPTTLLPGTLQSNPSHSAVHNLLHLFANQVYNVTDTEYGATGDGTTDDTAEIQAAIDAASDAGGGLVYFPPGRYVISSTITLKYRVNLAGPAAIPAFDYVNDADVSLLGSFSTIFLKANSNCVMLVNDRTNGPIQQADQHWQRSTISNLHFWGNCNNQGAGNWDVIDIEDCWGLDIEGCQITKPKRHGLRLASVNAFRLTRSNILLTSGANAGANCVYADDLVDSMITGCQIGGAPGSCVYVTSVTGAVSKAWLFQIHDNLIFNSLAGSAIELKDNATSDRGISIQANRLDQNFLNGVRVENTPGSMIIGNACVLNGFGNGSGQAGISLVTAPRTIISSNICAEYAASTENQDIGIDVGANCDYSTLIGNMTRPNDVSQIVISVTGNANVRAVGNPGFTDV
jgi:hypothetical protein